MLYAVQLRNDSTVKCLLIWGSATAFKQSSKGKVALFDADQIVIYCVAPSKIRKRAFVFRTAQPGVDKIPGVYPSVNLLAEAKTRGKVSRLAQVVDSLTRRNYDLNSLSDDFFVRLDGVLNNRYFTLSDVLKHVSHAKPQSLFTP